MKQIKVDGVERRGRTFANFTQGVNSVMFIRCMKHFKVPQYNENETGGAECAACEVEKPRSTLRAELEAERKEHDLAGRLAKGWMEKYEASEALLTTVVNIIGGEVEGAPTHRVNFLQRLRELVQREKDFAELYTSSFQ